MVQLELPNNTLSEAESFQFPLILRASRPVDCAAGDSLAIAGVTRESGTDKIHALQGYCRWLLLALMVRSET